MCTILECIAYLFAGLFIYILLIIAASNETLRYYLKFSFYTIILVIPPTFFWPFMLFRIRDWRNALVPAWCVRKCVRFLGVTFRVRGKENIVKDSGSIVLINHQSTLDLCVLSELWPVLKRGTVISKREVLYLGTFGLASWLWGTIFINRTKSEEAQSALNATAKSIKDLKANVLLFPEGHRHTNSTLMSFKKGAFHLAVTSQVPILPIVVSKYYFLNTKWKRFNSGLSYITILPPIPTKGLTKDDLPKLMQDTYKVMNDTFVESSQETLDVHIRSLKGDE